MQLANTARTTLVTGIGTGDTLIELADSSRFPAVTATILTGTATSTAGNAYSVTGTGTSFLSQLSAGDVVTWTGIEHRRVIAVVSDTVLLIDRPASVSGVTLTKRNAYYLTLVNGGGLNREYVLVMSTSGANFTVARAQDDSTALTFSAGATVEYRVTSAFIVQVIERAVQLTIANLQETHGADMIGVDAAGIVAVTARTALEELAAAIAAHLADSPAHAAADISFTPAAGIVATEVQAAIVELVNDAATALLGHVSDTTAHDATAIVFAPYGGISATEVQAAIEQLWDDFEAVTSNTDKSADVITTAGEEFSALDDTQLSKAVSTYVAGADYWTCTGSGAAFTLSAPTAFAGLPGTPTYTGTGNGSMTSLTGGLSSLAETFTIACTVGGATGTFTVTGSVSGALASATVGTPYSTTKIAFTINDGATDFIAGDTFTVVMGAAQSLRKPTQYFEGMRVRFIANAENTGAATIDVGGLGAVSVFTEGEDTAAYWREGQIVEVMYAGSALYKVHDHPGRVMYLERNDVTTPGTTRTFTWDKPAGFAPDDTVVFRMWGGGCSGSSSAGSGDGGGGGGFFEFSDTYDNIPATAAFVVGRGGNVTAPGAAVAGANTSVTYTGANGATVVATALGATSTTGAGATLTYAGVAFGSLTDLTPWRGGDGGAGTPGTSSVWGGGGGGGSFNLNGYAAGTSQFGGDGYRGSVSGDATPAPPGVTPGGGGGGFSSGVGTPGDGGDGRIDVLFVSGKYTTHMSLLGAGDPLR